MTRQRSCNSSVPFLPVLIVFLIMTVVVVAARGQASTTTSNPPLFQPGVTYDSGGILAGSVAVGDLNGDGLLDMVVANNCISYDDCPYNDYVDTVGHGTVGVLLGNGNGTFQPVATYGSGGYERPYLLPSAAVGDLNGDGKLDIVVTNSCGTSTDCVQGALGVLFGNGDGTFLPTWSFSSSGFYPVSVAVADINLDGHPDFLVANTCYTQSTCDFDGCTCTNGSVDVQATDGYGGFHWLGTYSTGEPWARSVTVGDVNADGKPDLLVANDGRLGVLLGNGDGTFQSAQVYGTGGSRGKAVAVGDLNGDGKPDILVANQTGLYPSLVGNVGVLLGNGDGTFQPAVPHDFGGGQSVTFRATVSLALGVPPNGELITFSSGSTILGTASLRGGIASMTTSSLPPRTQVIKATYAGDANFKPSTGKITQVVNGYTTTTKVASSLNPSIYGQKVTWTATVTSVGSTIPKGTVAFRSSQLGNTFTLGTATLNASGGATLTRSNLTAAYPYPITAVYLGDAWNANSTSAVLNQTVKQTITTASITSSPNPSSRGQAVTFTAKITSPTVTATGPVTFAVGYTVFGTAQLSGGKANFTLSTLPVGSTRVSVTYYGNSNIAKSSASLIQTVR